MDHKLELITGCVKRLISKPIVDSISNPDGTESIFFEDYTVLTLYPITNLQKQINEMDISMRLISPGLTKYTDIFSMDNIDACQNFQYGLLSEQVKCTDREKSLRDKLKSILSLLSGYIAFRTSNYNSEKYSYCDTLESAKFTHFNRVSRTDYTTFRMTGANAFVQKLIKTLTYDNYSIDNYDSLLKYPYNNKNYSFVENALIDDLLLRIFNADMTRSLDVYEIPLHPIFKLHDITFIEPDEQDVHVQQTIKFDYLSPIYNSISDLLGKNTSLTIFFEAVDLYYRYLPFITGNNMVYLNTIFIDCFNLMNNTLDTNKLSQYLHICTSMKGILRRRNFYHLIMTKEDADFCWKLMFIDYLDYMSIIGTNLYIAIEPSINFFNGNLDYVYEDNTFDFEQLDDNLINRMKRSYVNTKYIFNKLTTEEMLDFLETNKFSTDFTGSKFFLSDICQRVFTYRRNNGILTETQAVRDLILQSNWDYFVSQHRTGLFFERDIDNMTDQQIQRLALDIKITTTDNLRESVKRILRMTYLLSERDQILSL
jgi:hypothetical protein